MRPTSDAPRDDNNAQEPELDDDGEPWLSDDEVLARLARAETHWDRPDVKALLRQREQADEHSQE